MGASIGEERPSRVTALVVAVCWPTIVFEGYDLIAYVSRYYPAHGCATAVGWSLGVGMLGGIAGPLAGGLLLTWQAGPQWSFYAFALGSAVILMVPTSRSAGQRVVYSGAP